jgi:hypothetical protein
VLDWFGDWPDQAFYQVGMEFTKSLDLDLPSYNPPADFPLLTAAYRSLRSTELPSCMHLSTFVRHCMITICTSATAEDSVAMLRAETLDALLICLTWSVMLRLDLFCFNDDNVQ